MLNSASEKGCGPGSFSIIKRGKTNDTVIIKSNEIKLIE